MIRQQFRHIFAYRKRSLTNGKGAGVLSARTESLRGRGSFWRLTESWRNSPKKRKPLGVRRGLRFFIGFSATSFLFLHRAPQSIPTSSDSPRPPSRRLRRARSGVRIFFEHL